MNRPTIKAFCARATPDFEAFDRVSCFEWSVLLSPLTWLDHETRREYAGASGEDVRSIVSQAEIFECFALRKVTEPDGPESLIGKLLDADIGCFAHSLSALLSISDDDARRLMPRAVRDVIGNGPLYFDHIGIEVFGKLEWYIDLLDRADSAFGIHVTNKRVFPSVQVRHALSYDPDLRDVRIGRVFFSRGGNETNLEIFEATQDWRYIALRQASLYAHLKSPISRPSAVRDLIDAVGVMLQPVGHVAFRVPCADTVEAIQAVLIRESGRGDSTAHIRPYSQSAFRNPADGSVNTKFAISTTLPSGQRIDSHIVEILSYDAE